MPAIVPGPISLNGLNRLVNAVALESTNATIKTGAPPANISALSDLIAGRQEELKAKIQGLRVPPDGPQQVGPANQVNTKRNKNVLVYLMTSFNAMAVIIDECIDYLRARAQGDILIKANIKLQTAYNAHKALCIRISSKKHSNAPSKNSKNSAEKQISMLKDFIIDYEPIDTAAINLDVNGKDNTNLKILMLMASNPDLTPEQAHGQVVNAAAAAAAPGAAQAPAGPVAAPPPAVAAAGNGRPSATPNRTTNPGIQIIVNNYGIERITNNIMINPRVLKFDQNNKIVEPTKFKGRKIYAVSYFTNSIKNYQLINNNDMITVETESEYITKIKLNKNPDSGSPISFYMYEPSSGGGRRTKPKAKASRKAKAKANAKRKTKRRSTRRNRRS